jgi:hypothetical protein
MEPNPVAIERDGGLAGADGLPARRLSSVGDTTQSDALFSSAVSVHRLNEFRERALVRGVNPVLYRLTRAVLLPFFLLYFRLERIGREYVPGSGPVLLAANHRSFLDPFVIGALTRRPVYYVAKRELFERRLKAWLLNSLGAFPVDRGVIPVAVMGTEDVRRGWRIRPHKVTLRCGRPLGFPIAEHPSPSIVLGVAERIWACVSLQWEWLGGASAARPEELPDRSSPRQARAA